MDTKRLLGDEAAKFVEDNMIVGLGSGTTVNYLVRALGERVKEGLQIKAVSSSEKTRKLADEVGIPLIDINMVEQIDLTIDGANEIERNTLFAIKGGGGSLLYEKIMTLHSKEVIWIVDEEKIVHQLGKFRLPVEVIPYGCHKLFRMFFEKQYKPVLRKTQDGLFVTDSGHWIIDLHLEKIDHPKKLADWLKSLTGVVEHGLFLQCVDRVLVGNNDQIKVLEK